jgi:hypothetical protein
MLSGTALPYGLRDVRLTPYTDASALVLAATGIDLPNAQTFTFSDNENFEDLRGDDHTVTSHGNGSEVDWELGAGGLSFEAWQAMNGGTVTTTGVTPNQIKKYSKNITDQRPSFRIEGQSISDSGGDLHALIYRCKATGELTGSLEDGKFWITDAKGKGYANYASPVGQLYDFVQNESVVPIP